MKPQAEKMVIEESLEEDNEVRTKPMDVAQWSSEGDNLDFNNLVKEKQALLVDIRQENLMP